MKKQWQDMMDLSTFNLAQFGIAGVFIGFLIWALGQANKSRETWEQRCLDAMEKRSMDQKQAAEEMGKIADAMNRVLEACGKEH